MRIYNHISEFNPIAIGSDSNTIVTIGTFDGVHLGHQKIISRLNEIKQQQGGETLLFTFDPHPRKVLFPHQTDLKLITTSEEKIQLLKKFGIDHVLVFPFTKEFASMQANDYINDIIIKGLHTKTLVIGYDHRFGSNREGDLALLKKIAINKAFQVEEIPVQEINQLNVSSSRIRKALEDGDIETANANLGYPFFISGKVLHGKQLGRTIGYPTANIDKGNVDKLIPKEGVYAVTVDVENVQYKGMLNIGTNPTTDSDNKQKIEVNIFDFNQDIYHKTININFVKRVRDEQKFANLDELKNQLAKDKIVCSNV